MKRDIIVKKPFTHAAFVRLIDALANEFPGKTFEPAHYVEGGVEFRENGNPDSLRSIRMDFKNFPYVKDNWRVQFAVEPDKLLYPVGRHVHFQYRALEGYPWTDGMIHSVEAIARSFLE